MTMHEVGSHPRQASGSRPQSEASRHDEERKTSTTNCPPILSLPAELLDAILFYLSPHDLAIASRTCQHIRAHAIADVQWLPRVQANIPGLVISSPYPCSSYRELFAAHDPHWFLPKYKIWFSDRNLMGKMIVVRYDPRRGCIDGYQLVAVSPHSPSHQHWPANSDVVIHDFNPEIKIHLDRPVLQFHAGDDPGFPASLPPGISSKFQAETPMMMDNQPDYVYTHFSLARPVDDEMALLSLSTPFPYGCVWPPRPIPSAHRVAGFPAVPATAPEMHAERPENRAEVSDRAFRIRQWMEMANNLRGLYAMTPGGGPFGPHIGEEITTYSTLDPALYTPTDHKPWRGIWVGDYSGHGCEFLLINQPDDEDATDEELGLVRRPSEADEDWAKRQLDARIYRGRLEAIKLTGDPNVPRGECTFIAEDLGPDGFAGIATEEPFKGARIVNSMGHVANTGYHDDKYIPSQLFLISPDKLAQFWVDFGHISYFIRVPVDDLLRIP